MRGPFGVQFLVHAPPVAVARAPTFTRSEQAGPPACSVDLGRAIQEAQAYVGVGGAGIAACSGDILLGALAGG